MSESMIERVARATYEARPYGDEDAGDLTWAGLEEAWKERHRDMARAAIEAIFKGSRFTEIRGMTVIVNPEFPAQYWDGSELLEMLSADTALNE